MSRRTDRELPALFHFEPTSTGPHVRAFRLEPENTERFLTPHAHRFFELVYFEEPGGLHRLGHESWESAAGDLLVIAPGQVHEWAPDVLERQAVIWVLEFTAAALDPAEYAEGSLLGILLHPLLAPFAYGSERGSFRLSVPPDQRLNWEAALRELEAERRAQQPHWEAAVHSLFTLMLVQVNRLSIASSEIAPVPSQPLLRQVFEVIDSRFADRLSLTDVAQAVHHSPPHLTTTIRRLTGRTVGEWITERRMAEARRLLVHTDLGITQIATRVGYTDPAHFIRQFRRAAGSPPGAWRQANR
jgi:AraC family transcriptional regulator, transcriptional activator of pobA